MRDPREKAPPGTRYFHDLLGGKCARCGNTDWRVLQVDHIYGGGNKERVTLGMSYWRAVEVSIKRGEKKYQLLCANCNWIKREENRETLGRDPTAGPFIPCGCGCGKQISQFDAWGRERKYAHGHYVRMVWEQARNALHMEQDGDL